MSKIIWASEQDKFEAIGYLAKPGVVATIEATIPEDRLAKFKQEYDGKYSSEFPYTTKAGSKFGYQFRIYLQDTEGCPDFLEEQLDEKYNNRINDTAFIKELVLQYGFRFTHQPQDSEWIRKIVSMKCQTPNGHPDNFRAFRKGFYVYENFISSLSEQIKSKNVVNPIFTEPHMSKKLGTKKHTHNIEVKSSFTMQQLSSLGWLGEEYFYRLLVNKNSDIIEILNLSPQYSVEWFNKGCNEADGWIDKSVGQGCDITVSMGDEKIYFEVKSSKRKNPFFTMTSNEMQLMEKEKLKYYIVKIDYLEKLLKSDSPEIMIFDRPYDRYFKPHKMKEATFMIGE